MEEPIPSAEEIAGHYDRALSCVWHIDHPNPDDPGMVARCVEHLEMMVAIPWWDGYDLTPLTDAIARGKANAA